jgi:hypothetical protein
MKNHENANGAGLAGSLLVALPVLDLFFGAGNFSKIHAVMGFFGLLLCGVAVVDNAGASHAQEPD